MKNYHITLKSQVKLEDVEKMKMESGKSLDAAINDIERVELLLRAINAYYIRSSNRVLEDGAENPDFATYASHWLAAQKDGWAAIPLHVIERAAEEYSAPNNLAIEKGKSYWEPSLARKYNIALTISK
jgi:hypothetical protein